MIAWRDMLQDLMRVCSTPIWQCYLSAITARSKSRWEWTHEVFTWPPLCCKSRGEIVLLIWEAAHAESIRIAVETAKSGRCWQVEDVQVEL